MERMYVEQMYHYYTRPKGEVKRKRTKKTAGENVLRRSGAFLGQGLCLGEALGDLVLHAAAAFLGPDVAQTFGAADAGGFLALFQVLVEVRLADEGPGRRATEKWENGSTIAFAIFDPVTFEGVTALDTVRRSGGLAIALPDEEILEAMRACAKLEAVIPEPASAATIAAAAKLHRDGVIGGKDKAVCVLTGSGLRDLKLFSQEDVQVPEVQPGDMEALRRAVAFYQERGESGHDA